MFGYVVARKEGLSPEELARYRACYCGLCRSLKERHGQLSRLALHYDMTFLILLLASLYEPEETCGESCCPPHPLKKQSWWRCELTDYAADMNVALVYHKLQDDWQDEGDPIKKQLARQLRGAYAQVKNRWPRQCRGMERELAELARLERENDDVPDRAAACCGRLMAEVFHWRDDRWTETVEQMAFALGEFVYLQDAGVDLGKDLRKHRYNPLLALWKEPRPLAEYEPMLLMLAGQCAGSFERLPLVRDAGILKNILYHGMWSRYHQARLRQEQQKKAGKQPQPRQQ